MNSIDTGSGTVDYDTIRKAMANEPFTMCLTDSDEIKAVIAAVNEGIDGISKHVSALLVATDTRAESGRRGS